MRRKNKMKFSEALKHMKKGKKAKLPSWEGYWTWEFDDVIGTDTIVMYLKDGQVLDIRNTTDLEFTIENILSNQWLIIEE